MSIQLPPASELAGVLSAIESYPIAAGLILLGLYIWRRKGDQDKDK